jgi:hypothetical protein
MTQANSSKEYQITIEPRILELLGPNLYTNIYYVLAELIANAYDANAKNVYIIADKNEGLIVEDDGHGMSYEDGIKRFLNVAQESRTNDSESYVSGTSSKRRKMGRKGVGKLAALSVSKHVEIKTIKDGDKSGFVLSRNVGKDRKLKPLNDDLITFHNIADHGTSIVMRDPEYNIHTTLKAAKRNLLRIFPMVDQDFQIHIQIGKKVESINAYEVETVRELGALITLGSDFHYLHKYFDAQIHNDDSSLNLQQLQVKKESFKKNIELTNNKGEKKSYTLEIKGWIGAYRSTSNTKKHDIDFPDNYISLFSNKKLGEFNILPIVGGNKYLEVYIVGQFHIDLFEVTSLPDMALSNRQGYKTDDPRYVVVREKIQKDLLPTITNLRIKYASLKKSKKDSLDYKNNQEKEIKLKNTINNFKKSVAKKTIKNIRNLKIPDSNKIGDIVANALDQSFPDLGIKSTIDKNKKKLLISHSFNDKKIADFIYEMLIYTGVPASEILYSSADETVSRVPDKTDIFDYLRNFFVESYSTEKIYVIYITSQNLNASWPALSEIGAGWITKSEHDIININNFMPKKPLDINSTWANVNFENTDGTLSISKLNIDLISNKLIYICEKLGCPYQLKKNIHAEINKRAITM